MVGTLSSTSHSRFAGCAANATTAAARFSGNPAGGQSVSKDIPPAVGTTTGCGLGFVEIILGGAACCCGVVAGGLFFGAKAIKAVINMAKNVASKGDAAAAPDEVE
jgi:hypothetical protein